MSDNTSSEARSLDGVLNESITNPPVSEEDLRKRLEHAGQRDNVATDPDLDALETRKRLTDGVAYVYVPTHPSSPKANGLGQRQVQFELRELSDGSGGLPVFTEVELLIAQLGEFQTWEKVPVLELLIQISAAKVQVVVNPVLQEGVRRRTAADLEIPQEDS